MNNRSETLRNILVPVLSVVMGFVLGAVIMLAFGYQPIEGYQAMFETAFQGRKSIGEIFVTAAPLIFTALGFSVANAAGFFNIGLSGQALCGWVASIWVALSFPDMSRWIVLPLAVIVGALAGAFAAAIPGILRAYFGTSEVIVTIMLNYIFLYVANHIANNVMKASIMANKGITKMVGANASLRTPFLTEISEGSRLNLGIFLAFIFLIIIWFLMKKTTLGFEIRSVGLNPFASEYAGMSSKRTIILSMVISGALAGLGGVIQGLGTFQNFFIQNSSLSIGFDGMAVSLLGAGSSIGILLSALLFGMLKLGGQGMPFVGVPTELVDVVIASIIFFIGINYLIRFVLAKTSGNKKELAVVETIESTEDENKQEGGTI
ncbi:ABC transporter permease [Enterococcus rivorum]|uniref:Branched-chain amino acid ABC transporter permease n=1 Tax=Enterococcus rivorum TaxID=762845 RepID=A0A1E5L1T5_9ENTE|nr:ABC transporter permease [Enterococcus rivorum]MBP2097824.1 simple sugar transport system permease protein [Enterococcus rivorum]OEH84085.1 branched-chain amino acid ABC transporter permease [Enterococcus rivorum]